MMENNQSTSTDSASERRDSTSFDADLQTELNKHYQEVAEAVTSIRQQHELEKAYFRRRASIERERRQSLEKTAYELHTLRRSPAFRLDSLFQRVKDRLIPDGSRRRWMARVANTAVVTLIKRGPKEFARIVGMFLRGERGYWQQVDLTASKTAEQLWRSKNLDPATTLISTPVLELSVSPTLKHTQYPHRVHLSGWALDTQQAHRFSAGVDAVRFYLGDTAQGRFLGEVKPSIPHADLAKTFSSESGHSFAGFEILLKNLPAGPQKITAQAHHYPSNTSSKPVTVDVEVFGNEYWGDFTDLPYASDLNYQSWIVRHEPDFQAVSHQFYAVESWATQPLFTLITFIKADHSAVLSKLIRSVLRQNYEHWEWHFLVPPSVKPPPEIISLGETDSRIHVFYGEHDQEASILQSWGEKTDYAYALFVEAEALLAPSALYEFALALQAEPHLELLYSDHDELDAHGQRSNPFFKPDWSPQLLLSTPYALNLAVFSKSLLEKIGFFSTAYNKFYLWDALLKTSRIKPLVKHIAKILYHQPHSKQMSLTGEEQSIIAKMLTAHLEAHQVIEPSVHFSEQHPQYPFVTWQLADWSRISVIIPSRDIEMVSTLLAGLFTRTDYPNLEVILVYTGQEWDSTRAKMQSLFPDETRLTLVQYDQGDQQFNYHKANHAGYEHATGDLILFMNDDTEVIEPAWLKHMAQWFALTDVGAVGAKLLFPNETIQHAGVIIGMHGLVGHVFLNELEYTSGPWGTDHWYRNLSSVTAACILVKREVFETVGRFDERYLMHFGDVDLGLRISQAPYQVIYTPHARLIHRESTTTLKGQASHTKKFYKSDWQRFANLWMHLIRKGDPFYNVNLSIMTSKPTLNSDVYSDASIYLEERMLSLSETE